MNAERTIGRRYSHAYLDPGQPVYESKRLQARTASYIINFAYKDAESISTAIGIEIGMSFPYQSKIHHIAEYIRKCSTSEFLDCITIITQALHQSDSASNSYDRNRVFSWLQFVTRAMAEENSKFEIDEKGGVHPRIDPEFAIARVASIQLLGSTKYSAARQHFEACHKALDERPPATNRAVREIFMANEEIFKILCPRAKRLESNEVTSKLTPLIQSNFSGTECDAAQCMSRTLTHYIATSHLYRHAQGEPEQSPLSLETATFIIGTGTALLRWLIWLDKRIHDGLQNAHRPQQ